MVKEIITCAKCIKCGLIEDIEYMVFYGYDEINRYNAWLCSPCREEGF
jgi:hypothetical protein